MVAIFAHCSRYYAVEEPIACALFGQPPAASLDAPGAHYALLSYQCSHCPDEHHIILASWHPAGNFTELIDTGQGGVLVPCEGREVAEALFDRLAITEALS